ncbi:MAG: L,D-transpeptidase [Pseudomonadota bacterium]|nr:L,D-transpeptidase [Pseudomonadota bacterium]
MSKHTSTLLLVPALLLAAAGSSGAIAQDPPTFSLPGAPEQLFTGATTKELLAAQILLDHSGHSPGVVDGAMGGNTVRAIEAFQRANDMTADGKVSEALLRKLQAAYSGELTQRYTITADDVSGPFVSVPEDMEDQAELDTLGYESPAEAIAEKFHMSQGFLKALNPGADFASPGTEITVIVPGKDKLDAKVVRIEVDKAAASVRAYSEDGALVATYPATVGSSTFPSPDGSMEVTTVAAAPTYHFSPEGRDWGPDKKLTIAAGPNNPVGGTWIDLSKEGYGIHGTPDPKLIGKTSSHGCVRLTNWDAEELAEAVSKGTKVEFV